MNDTPSRPSLGDPKLGLGMPVETQLGNEFSGQAEPGVGTTAQQNSDTGLTLDVDGNSAQIRKDDEAAQNLDKTKDEGTTQDAAPLPDFNPEDPATVQAYEGRFTAEGGKGYNMAALSADFFANKGEGLSEGTYKWLESRGIDRATAKAIEEGQKALGNTGVQAIFTRAGGEAPYRSAIEWAKAGGYNEAQRKAFNAALDAGGTTAEDAVDLLMARSKAKGGTFQAERRQQPERTVSSAGGGTAPADPAVKPYANYQEYQNDLRAAKKNNDQTAYDLTRKRLKVSKFA